MFSTRPEVETKEARQGKDKNVIFPITQFRPADTWEVAICYWNGRGIHWSQWSWGSKLINKLHFWTIETIVKWSLLEDNRRHVTHYCRLCFFSMCTLCNFIELSKVFLNVKTVCDHTRGRFVTTAVAYIGVNGAE